MLRPTTIFVVVVACFIVANAQRENPQQTVIMRLEPQNEQRASFMRPVDPPHAISAQAPSVPQQARQPMAAVPTATAPRTEPNPVRQIPSSGATASPPGTSTPVASPVHAQQPVLAPASEANSAGQQFDRRELAVPPQAPPVNIPPDVQNQLIKFFGLDSFGIPGLTGNHPNGFAGAVQELRAAGIPVQGIPPEHVGAQPMQLQPQGSELLGQANPNFANGANAFQNIMSEPAQFHSSSGGVPLPDAKPGENGLIGLLSSSIRKLFKDSGVADALSQSLPNVLGTQGQSSPSSVATSASHDAPSTRIGQRRGESAFEGELPDDHSISTAASNDEASSSVSTNSDNVRRQQSSDVRRQQSPAERALSGFASALGGGGPNSPSHAGLPRIPGIPLLPGGIPRNAQGQIDVVNLIGSITRRISNGTTLADVLPPDQLQTLADNVTDALLPSTPEDFDLNKFMGRWFEGINSPRASEQRCVVHHYGGLTKNDKTATFTALKIYRDGSEFGTVRYSIGYAFRAGNKDAMLQLHSSENSDAQPFWVYKLGPQGTDPFGNKQYEYAIVSNWVKYPVTVLVRDPDSFKTKYEIEVLRWLEDQGFINGFVRAFNLLQPASYSSCQYADNTFELFGR
ncbi:Calycin-like domain and Calycin domain-containing protein [Aphelenchoides besseyi]|nr:Calycin-like domain and Calycin domain-containing protein [Aphelenchoides besseyi]KAI6202500.1 Calycin-like domain and Calycin domain-containing protein [Aphelenchoides besseyi]